MSTTSLPSDGNLEQKPFPVEAMILILSCVWLALLGVVYGFRLATNAWAAPALHKQQAFTGTWVGVLSGDTVVAPDLSPSPYLSERHRQDSIADYNRSKAQARAVRHAIMLHTSLDYFYLGSARAKGTARFCDADGTASLFTAESGGSSTDAMMRLELFNKDPQSGGGLDLHRTDGTVQATYNGADVPIRGVLRPGTEADFRQLCASLK
jgi:hypothetical protein